MPDDRRPSGRMKRADDIRVSLALAQREVDAAMSATNLDEARDRARMAKGHLGDALKKLRGLT